ncbi:MAG TPA: NUDIX hydrolase [Acidimicrobiales bacterium]|nr:NUDIX hydrolase [Acidimicrobiales bacterium]
MSFRSLGETCLHQGHVISLYRGRFVAPDGSPFEREIVRHPGAVVVVPLVDDSTALLVRQYRAAIDSELLELPAGKRDVPDEDPADTAARELAEEVGKRPGRLVKLAEFLNSPGFSDELSHCYLATELEDCDTDAQGVEEGHMVTVTVDLAEVPGMIERFELRDAKTIIGLCMARAYLGEGGRL